MYSSFGSHLSIQCRLHCEWFKHLSCFMCFWWRGTRWRSRSSTVFHCIYGNIINWWMENLIVFFGVFPGAPCALFQCLSPAAAARSAPGRSRQPDLDPPERRESLFMLFLVLFVLFVMLVTLGKLLWTFSTCFSRISAARGFSGPQPPPPRFHLSEAQPPWCSPTSP